MLAFFAVIRFNKNMSYYDFMYFFFYGLVVGVLAKSLFPAKDSGGLVLTSALGVLGSILGGGLFKVFGWPYEKALSLAGVLPGLIGAFVILIFYTLGVYFLKKRAR